VPYNPIANTVHRYIYAGVISSGGVGHMNIFAPTWTSESAHRRKSFALVFSSNYGNIINLKNYQNNEQKLEKLLGSNGRICDTTKNGAQKTA